MCTLLLRFILWARVLGATAPADVVFHSFPYDVKINRKLLKLKAWPAQFIKVNAVQSSHGPV